MTARYRVGRKVGRTLYRMVDEQPSDDDIFIGAVDSHRDAETLVACANRNDELENLYDHCRTDWFMTMDRMKRSIKTLELSAWDSADETERARLSAKASGVKLALSYMEELARGE